MASGFYEGGGYAGYNGGSNNGGYDMYNASGIGSSDVFGGSMGSVPTQRPDASSSSEQQHSEQLNPKGNPNSSGSMDNVMNNAMNFWSPTSAMTMAASAAATGNIGDVNSQVMMNVAESMGKQFLETGWAKAVPGLERSMLGLRPYFAVDNSYVKRKMTKVLFPFLYREWARDEIEPNPDGSMTYALPQQDENAPDLYIPSMSLLTYVLLCALCYGNAGKFDPEVLPDVMSKCALTQVIEVIAIRIGFYFMEAPVPILDLLSYTGYKYLGLSVNMFIGLVVGHFGHFGHRSYYFTYLWTATAISYFILKVMANCIPRRTSDVGPKRQLMVLGFAGSQFATCWFVSQVRYL